eukprot:TRINITY_DN7073_c0_g1_i1.p1 TRINITY_DN7073_c0_g1~~TRINITY_DN7073_c0_g1_i1.p1  ORF type:complete len:992 (+),score=276.91 TRINITY_DN7073_c0_g1_i1:147-3122(+)
MSHTESGAVAGTKRSAPQNSAAGGGSDVGSSSYDGGLPPKKKVKQEAVKEENHEMKEVDEEESPLDMYIKDGMRARITELGRERNTYRRRVEEMEAKQLSYENTLSVLNRHWDKLDEEILTLSSRLPSHEKLFSLSSAPTDGVAASVPASGADMTLEEVLNKLRPEDQEEGERLTYLQLLVSNYEKSAKAESRDMQIPDALLQRTTFTSSVVLRLVHWLETQGQITDSSREKLRSLSAEGAAAEVAADNRRLCVELADAKESLEFMQGSYHARGLEVARARDLAIDAQQRADDAQIEADNAVADLEQTRRTIDRLNRKVEAFEKGQKFRGKTASEIAALRTAAPGGTSTPPPTLTTTTSTTATPTSSAASASTSVSAGPEGAATEGDVSAAAAVAQVKELEEELREALTKCKSRFEEIRQLREERAEMQDELRRLRHEVITLPEERVLACPLYTALRSQFAQVQESLQEYSLQKERDLVEVGELQKRLEESLAVARRDFDEREQVLRKQLGDSDNEVRRLRLEVDDLKLEKQRQEAEASGKGPAGEVQELVKSQQNHIAQMRMDLDRSAKRLEEASTLMNENGVPSATPKTDPELRTAFEKKDIECHQYVMQLKKFEKINQGLIAYQTSAKRKERDLQQQLSSLLEQDKERRAINQVRLCEMQLRSENTRLVEEVAKYKREWAAAKLPPMESFENQKQKIEHLQADRSEVSRQLAKADRAVAELTYQVNANKEMESQLMQEMEAIAKEYETVQEQNARLTTAGHGKDNTARRLLSEEHRMKQLQQLLRQEQTALEERTKRLEALLQSHEKALEAERKERVMIEEVFAKRSDEWRHLSSSHESQRRELRTSDLRLAEMQAKHEHAERALAEIKQQADEASRSLEKEAIKARKMEEDRNTIKRKFERLSKQSGSNKSDSLLEQEIDEYKKIFNCSQCNERGKNAVIVRCGHCFCRECINTNLKARNRKCPECKMGYNDTDVQNIYLGVDSEYY